MDVNDKVSIQAAVDTIKSADGRLDILVNKYVTIIKERRGLITNKLTRYSAGIVGPRSVLEDDKPSGAKYGDFLFRAEDFNGWHEVLSTDTISLFFVTTAFLGLLESGARKRGMGETSSVINISSGVAHTKLSLDVVSIPTT